MSGKWERVEFRAYDGTKLRGNLYRASEKHRPIVIMTQGLALLKEHYLPNWAKRFQEAGFNVLTYDHRNFGDSEGAPRNEVHLYKQSDDYVDAVTYAQTIEDVDKNKVFIWGIGHSGGGCGTAAAMDRRIAGAILVMPSLSGRFDFDNWPEYLHREDGRDRSQGAQKSASERKFWRFWPITEDLERTTGDYSMLNDDSSYNWAKGAWELTKEGGAKFDNQVAITSLHHIYKARPGAFFKDISPTPVLFLAATIDPVAAGLADEQKVFESMGEPKEFVVLEGSHLDNYFGLQFERGVTAMIKWLEKYSR